MRRVPRARAVSERSISLVVSLCDMKKACCTSETRTERGPSGSNPFRARTTRHRPSARGANYGTSVSVKQTMTRREMHAHLP